jgi:hypothetical protein
MSKEDQIDVLKEVKEQILAHILSNGLAQILSNDYTHEGARAYLDVVGIVDEKIKEVRYKRQFRG